MADEDNRARDPADCRFHQGDVLFRCVETVLRCNTLIPLRLKGNDQLAEARAIGPESVAENNAWLALGRCHFVLLGCFHYARTSLEPETAVRPVGRA